MRVHLDPFARQKNCGAGTLKHGGFEFERGRPKREGGRSATVCRFGENPGHTLRPCAARTCLVTEPYFTKTRGSFFHQP